MRESASLSSRLLLCDLLVSPPTLPCCTHRSPPLASTLAASCSPRVLHVRFEFLGRRGEGRRAAAGRRAGGAVQARASRHLLQSTDLFPFFEVRQRPGRRWCAWREGHTDTHTNQLDSGVRRQDGIASTVISLATRCGCSPSLLSPALPPPPLPLRRPRSPSPLTSLVPLQVSAPAFSSGPTRHLLPPPPSAFPLPLLLSRRRASCERAVIAASVGNRAVR